jgi:hypothetical protein
MRMRSRRCIFPQVSSDQVLLATTRGRSGLARGLGCSQLLPNQQGMKRLTCARGRWRLYDVAAHVKKPRTETLRQLLTWRDAVGQVRGQRVQPTGDRTGFVISGNTLRLVLEGWNPVQRSWKGCTGSLEMSWCPGSSPSSRQGRAERVPRERRRRRHRQDSRGQRGKGWGRRTPGRLGALRSVNEAFTPP